MNISEALLYLDSSTLLLLSTENTIVFIQVDLECCCTIKLIHYGFTTLYFRTVYV